jgi:hypothetical protein
MRSVFIVHLYDNISLIIYYSGFEKRIFLRQHDKDANYTHLLSCRGTRHLPKPTEAIPFTPSRLAYNKNSTG